MNPNMPATGEQIYCVKIIRGTVEITQAGTVRDRNGFQLTEDEFTTTHGSRYDCKYLFPGQASFFWPARNPEDSLFMYCRSQDQQPTINHLKADYIQKCIAAETELQDKARILHAYASQVNCHVTE